MPRSQTIQDLSVFAARLGAGTNPMARAHHLPTGSQAWHHASWTRYWRQSRRLLLRIITIGTDPERWRSIVTANRGQDQGIPSTLGHLPTMDLGMGFDAPLGLGNDLDFMQWLQNTDMERADVWHTFCSSAPIRAYDP